MKHWRKRTQTETTFSAMLIRIVTSFWDPVNNLTRMVFTEQTVRSLQVNYLNSWKGIKSLEPPTIIPPVSMINFRMRKARTLSTE